MRLVSAAFAALVAGLPSLAPAQTETPLELGIPGDMVLAARSAFTIVNAEDDRLVLFAHAGFLPVVRDYAHAAPAAGISVSICGHPFPPFQPGDQMGAGRMDIPLGDRETARLAADVLAGLADCDSFTAHHGAAAPAPLGLTLSSPSDSYAVRPDEVLSISPGTSPHTGAVIINLAFGPDLAAWIEVETGEHIGETIEISVCGEVITAPTVQVPIAGGNIQIHGGFTKTEAETMAARILGEIPCAPPPSPDN
ncbi:SecDF P1 head subdomain-containing protein [Gymnodinialimonas ceratoperidinii]|uniref:SecDF P1 head subdomain domain-containing protein n=1 Tax=Gymnodinialimonas ceratoperidinii TaxID=2856823 RepID=A0A8F6TY96_9RHOB|nr:hypothetical protein [Gymnodinialimonas ceratoperidinii]QXT39916.1 hypothetical protein KYE46_01240 [Gymnodinialimonas ceratoperidinii]